MFWNYYYYVILWGYLQVPSLLHASAVCWSTYGEVGATYSLGGVGWFDEIRKDGKQGSELRGCSYQEGYLKAAFKISGLGGVPSFDFGTCGGGTTWRGAETWLRLRLNFLANTKFWSSLHNEIDPPPAAFLIHISL